MTCESCGDKPKKCNKDFTKAVIEIDNPEQITLMRKVTVPASMGDDTTVPPVVGKYHNVLLYYEANSKTYLYSSDGIPTQLVNGVTDYEAAVNLPQINGVTLLGDKSSADLGLADAPMIITVAEGNASWSGADTAEDVYNFFLNKGKVSIVFEGGENYAYEIDSAGYIPEEEKLMCTLSIATMATVEETTEFDGNALFGTITLYTADKAIDVSQIELQPKLYVADFTGLDLNYDTLSGVPATNAAIGMVKPGDGLEVDANGAMSISDIEQYAEFFDTVADMKAFTNFVDGSFAQTLGYYAKNDGGASMYKIRTKTGADTPDEMLLVAIGDDLVAELIYDTAINSKQCGLKGDGTTDESTKLSTFLNLDIPNKVINKGKYVFSTPLFIKGTWGNRTNRSLITYTFKDSTFKYTGTADTVAMTFFNIQYGEIEGLNLSSDSNTCTINVIGVWDTNFKNCVINSLTLTSDGTSISAYSPATTALQYVTFKDCLIKGTVTFTKPVGSGWVNCIYFENCMLNGNNNAYANAIVYNGVASFQNIQFDKCDISYYSTAIVKANDAITDKFASLTFNHCYIDRGTMVDGSPNNSPKIVLLNTTNPNNAQSMTAMFNKRMMGSNLNNTGYASGNNIGCEGINYLYNGDLSSSNEETGNYSALGESGRGWTKTWTTSSRNRFNRARKLVYDGETENPAIIFYGINAPRDGFYPSFIRGRIISGTCTKIQAECYGSYTEYQFSEIGTDEFLFICSKDTNYRTEGQYLRMTMYVIGPSQDFEIEIYECGAFMGDTYMPNMPVHLLADRNT